MQKRDSMGPMEGNPPKGTSEGGGVEDTREGVN